MAPRRARAVDAACESPEHPPERSILRRAQPKTPPPLSAPQENSAAKSVRCNHGSAHANLANSTAEYCPATGSHVRNADKTNPGMPGSNPLGADTPPHSKSSQPSPPCKTARTTKTRSPTTPSPTVATTDHVQP